MQTHIQSQEPCRCLLLSCSQAKISTPDLLPAIRRYDGPAFRVLRKFLAEVLVEVARHASSKAQACLQPVLDLLAKAALGEGVAPSALLGRVGGANEIRAALTELTSVRQPDAAAEEAERILRLLLHLDDALAIYPTDDRESGGRRLVFRLVDPNADPASGIRPYPCQPHYVGHPGGASDNDEALRYQAAIFDLPPEGTMTRKYASPFPLRNQRRIHCPDALGTYRGRGVHMRRYVEHITAAGQATPGVTAVFFSSIEVTEALGDDAPDKTREYARYRLLLALVLQACGRGIRSGEDRWVFVLLDRRYHDYGWRRFLDPIPYNVLRPKSSVQGLHSRKAIFADIVWDIALPRRAMK